MKTKNDDLKEKILQESIKLFLAKGFWGSSTNELVHLAGVSKGTLYWYFENKNDILHKILDRYCEDFIEGAKREINACGGDFPVKFRKYYKFTSELSRDKRELLLVFIALLIEFAGTDCDIESRMKQINDQYNMMIQNMIEDGIQDGTVRSDIDPVIYSRFVGGTLMGSHVQWFLYLSSYENDPVYNRKHALIQRDEILKILLSEQPQSIER
jgi:AcrR family transcriptional regulator